VAASYPRTPVVAGLDGDWAGVSEGATKIPYRLHIRTDANGTTGTFDSPDLGVEGFRLSGLHRWDRRVTFNINPLGMFFIGALAPDGSLSGQLCQDGVFSGRIEFARGAAAGPSAAPPPPPLARQLPAPAAVDAARLAADAGVCDLSDMGTPEMVITARDGRLFARIVNPGMGYIFDPREVELVPASATRFLGKESNVEAEFAEPVDGRAPYAVVHALGRYAVAQRASKG